MTIMSSSLVPSLTFFRTAFLSANHIDKGSDLIATDGPFGNQQGIFRLRRFEPGHERTIPATGWNRGRLVIKNGSQLQSSGILIDFRIVVIQMPLKWKSNITAALKLDFDVGRIDGVVLVAFGLSVQNPTGTVH